MKLLNLCFHVNTILTNEIFDIFSPHNVACYFSQCCSHSTRHNHCKYVFISCYILLIATTNNETKKFIYCRAIENYINEPSNAPVKHTLKHISHLRKRYELNSILCKVIIIIVIYLLIYSYIQEMKFK